MKEAQREIYLVLANEIGWSLCNFCKYVQVNGSCGDSEIECEHPLFDKSDGFENMAINAMDGYGGGDCWAFRSSHPVSFLTDIVGAIIANGWDYATWWRDETGVWKVSGRKDRR